MTEKTSITPEERAAKAHAYIAEMKAKAKVGPKPLRLGELTELLELLPSDAPIRFDNGEKVGPFASWRGSYEMLSLEPNGGAL